VLASVRLVVRLLSEIIDAEASVMDTRVATTKKSFIVFKLQNKRLQRFLNRQDEAILSSPNDE
jgi:hypothetical protein